MVATDLAASTYAKCRIPFNWTTPGPCSGYPSMPPPTGSPSTPRPVSTCCWCPRTAPTRHGWKQKKEGTCMQPTAMRLQKKLPSSSRKSLAMRFVDTCFLLWCSFDGAVGFVWGSRLRSSKQPLLVNTPGIQHKHSMPLACAHGAE